MNQFNILYIGRFQPFHNGHVDAIQQIITDAPKNAVLYIGIGSAEENFTASNPLTAGERFQMISAALHEMNLPIPFFIVPIRNINHYDLWPYHVQQYVPPIHHFYSGSPLVKQLWGKAFPEKKISSLAKNKDICASDIRKHPEKMIQNHCPLSVQTLWKEWDISQRIKNMTTA